METSEKIIEVNGVNLYTTSIGEGPLVIMCHGFPGIAYTWRHQMKAIADAGFKAVAYDQRGYGRSSRPAEIEAYDSNQQIADLLGLLNAFGEEQAIFMGHDFGAPLVWNMAVRHPEKCVAIIPISCPYDFDLAGRNGNNANTPAPKPTEIFAEIAKQHFIHLHYFQAIGPADSELGNNAKEFLKRIYWALSAKGNLLGWDQYPSDNTGYLDVLEEAPNLPWDWLDEHEIDIMTQQYELLGKEKAFTGGLNNYRVADRNWKIGKAYAGENVTVKTLFITGDKDPVLQMVGEQALELMKSKVKQLEDIVIIENAGHFVQMEQKALFNEHVINFLKTCL